MNFVGIDLAWGERAITGLAVLDESGTLIHMSKATDDDSIGSALGDYLAGGCMVGFDAPLVVTNPTGNRPCEAALNHDFARFEAGAYPSNTGKPEFSEGPRGGRLAARFDLDLDPASEASRRAIEVYPHAALVALFRLGRTLKYKQRASRPFGVIHAETLRLLGLLGTLERAELPLRLSGNADWAALVTDVAAAARKSDLRRAEDQIDAVVCAYVAMLAAKRPDAISTYGEPTTGQIVTPTLPKGLVPAPREQAGVDAVGAAVREYARIQPQMDGLAQRLAAWLTTILDDAGINYLDVAWRGKRMASFATKAAKTRDSEPMYPDPLVDITDQIGVRIITYVTSDVAAVADLISDQLRVVEDKDLGKATAREGRFGYVSRHLQVALDPVWLGEAGAESVRVGSAQIQLRTVLQHAWAEFEHDIRYKGTVPKALAPDLNRRFTLAAGLLELADREFEVIRDRMSVQMAEETAEARAHDRRIGDQDLAGFLAGQYPDAGWSRTEHYAWMSGLLLELGITSMTELAGLLPVVDASVISERMGYKYPPGAVRRLDDALLAVYGTRYVVLEGNSHRVEPLRTRLEKLRMATGPGVTKDPSG